MKVEVTGLKEQQLPNFERRACSKIRREMVER